MWHSKGLLCNKQQLQKSGGCISSLLQKMSVSSDVKVDNGLPHADDVITDLEDAKKLQQFLHTWFDFKRVRENGSHPWLCKSEESGKLKYCWMRRECALCKHLMQLNKTFKVCPQHKNGSHRLTLLLFSISVSQ